MDNANVTHIKNVYAAFSRGDLPAVLASLAPDVTWGMVGRPRDVPFAGVREGKAGAAEFFRLLDETQDLKNFEPREFVTAGDMVFCWGRYDWTMRGSGVSGSSDWLHVFTLKDGRIAKWRGHQDTAKLAEAYHSAPAARVAATA